MRAIKGFVAKTFVADVVREHVAPILSNVGFRKTGNLSRRQSDEWWDLISIQMNRWGTAESSSAGIHIGVWWLRIEELASPEYCGRPPKEWECTVRGVLASRNWWC